MLLLYPFLLLVILTAVIEGWPGGGHAGILGDSCYAVSLSLFLFLSDTHTPILHSA